MAAWLLAHEEEIGCRYESFDLWRPRDAQAGGRFQFRSVGRQLALTIRFARWIRSAPTTMHYCVTCSVLGLSRDVLLLLIARISGRRVVAHIHGSEFVTSWTAPFFQVPALRLVKRLTTQRVALTPWAQKELGKLGIGSTCIPNPLAVRPAKGAPAKHVSAAPGLRLLFVGRLGKMKGCETLIDAVATARKTGTLATLRFIGKEMYDGEEAALRERVKRHQLDEAVEFAGTRRPEDLADCYAAADVICLPSRREVLPMALLEGMAYGLPALASTAGGIPDVVEPGRSGYLVSWNRVDELVAGIEYFAADPDRRQAMGESARERALSLTSPETIIEQWRRTYDANEIAMPVAHS